MAYAREAGRAAVAFMLAEPGVTLHRIAMRIYVFWCGDIFDQWPWQPRAPWWQGGPMQMIRKGIRLGLTIIPLVWGMVLLLKGNGRNIPLGILWWGLILGVPIVYYLTNANPIYAAMVKPCLLIVIGLMWIKDRRRIIS